MKKILSVLLALTLICMAGCLGGSTPPSSSAAGSTPAPAETPSTDAGADAGTDTPAPADGEVYELKIGGTVPDDHPITIALYKFAEDVNTKSGGRIKATVYANNQMGSGRELYETVQMNNLQMCENSIAAIAPFTDKCMALSLPFMFPTREVAYGFVDGQYGQEISDAVAGETGLKIVGWYENGIRQFTNSKRPIVTPDDLSGIKTRVMDSPMFIKMFEVMGASPTPMAFAEVFTALQQKTIDAQDNPYTIVVTNKFYEAQTYITDLSHCFDYTVVCINNDFYNSLPDDLKAILDECMADSVAYQRELSIQAEQDNKALLKENMEFTELTLEQRQVFRDKCEPVYDWFRSEYNKDNKLDDYLAEVDKIATELGVK